VGWCDLGLGRLEGSFGAGVDVGPVAERVLDDAVLEGVVGTRRCGRPAAQRVDGGGEAALEGAEFVVDDDAQRLEGAACRMVAPRPGG
jgi:hypothetical protein